ncbi:MAG: phenylalanine--tRNA ligase subunit beta [Nitrososphaeraceae archaeon]
MPVVNIKKSRLKSLMPNTPLKDILKIIPYIGLDIEGMDKNHVRIEYNPNRPDFSSDIGICRSLKGLLTIEEGTPTIKYSSNKEFVVNVDNSVKSVRPLIFTFIAKNKKLNDIMLEQLISIQEDIHNGIGRGRKKASIGIHDLDKIIFPIIYTTTSESSSFIPLHQLNSQTISQLLKSDIGLKYANLLNNKKKFPILLDSNDNIISFPPIINSNKTKITKETSNLFIEITANNYDVALQILAILSFYFYDEGFEIFSNIIQEKKKKLSPLNLLTCTDLPFTKENISDLLGISLNIKEIINCLRKSRLSVKRTKEGLKCVIPPYRTDISNVYDIAEETAIGYGVFNITPTLPNTKLLPGKVNASFKIFDDVRYTLIGLGFIEVLNFSLIDIKLVNQFTNSKNFLSVLETKSKDHEILKNSLIPSLITNLSHNIHEEYPQKIFEIGKVFHLNNKKEIIESWNLSSIIISNNTNYTEIKSILQSLLKLNFNMSISTPHNNNSLFINGRCGSVNLSDGKNIGILGELHPSIIDSFNLKLPVTLFEINLTTLFNSLNSSFIK